MRHALGLSLLVALSACSGSSAGGLLGGGGTSTFLPCDPGTAVQLANPTPSQTGVSSSIGQITFAANGSTDTLFTTYNQWSLTLYDGLGNVYPGNRLSLVLFPGLPHPYGASTFYYASSISGLVAGRTYDVRLGWVGQNCNEFSVGSFST